MRQHGKNLTAFVLAGGGSLGAVQVGMLAALARRGVVPDLVVGASVGAINAAYYAAEPDERRGSVAHLMVAGLPDAFAGLAVVGEERNRGGGGGGLRTARPAERIRANWVMFD